MTKHNHEFRDPIHTFIRVDTDERQVIDSRPFQRLREIHQLSMSYLVYPAATHKRFEHSLGVMELATRIFDVITNNGNLHSSVKDHVPQGAQLEYWRRVLRMGALCHDIGHLPFSHAAEHELLPKGWDHERLTVEIICSAEMQEIWKSITPPLRAEDIVKVAVGQKKLRDFSLTIWENLVSEIVVSDFFGADRIDYLLRDAYHTGVAYGRFDHHRLIDTLRILPRTSDDTREPSIGIEAGGLQSAEALILARYFMYKQVYFHPVRRIYDIHLQDFLKAHLPGARFPTNLRAFLNLTDVHVLGAMHEAVRSRNQRLAELARRIIDRRHFKLAYEITSSDIERDVRAVEKIYAGCRKQFGVDSVRSDSYAQRSLAPDFPVWGANNEIVSSLKASDVFSKVPTFSVNYVFADRSKRDKMRDWIGTNRDKLLARSTKRSKKGGAK